MDIAFWAICGAILALLVLSAFFSGSETALTAASRGKLQARAERGDRGARRALEVTEDRERLIGSVLLGNNLVNILAASLATALFTRLFGESGVALAALVMTALVLVFAEVLPKTYAITNAEAAASRAAAPIRVAVGVFSPVVAAVRWLVRGVLALFGVRADPDGEIHAVREEIVGALQLGRSEGVVEKDHLDRIMGAMDLGERTVEEVMRHRSELEMIDASQPPRQVMDRCLRSPHTRLPVFENDPDNIIGVVHVKDLLRTLYRRMPDSGADPADALRNFDVRSVAKKPYFIPETTTLEDQMRQFLRLRTHFALVVDEYGVLMGVITLEDILEEIVGEITDEFDPAAESHITRIGPNHFLVDGGMSVRDLNRETEWALPDEEANTVAGLAIHEAKVIPEVGQIFQFHGFSFEIVEKSRNRITKIRMRKL